MDRYDLYCERVTKGRRIEVKVSKSTPKAIVLLLEKGVLYSPQKVICFFSALENYNVFFYSVFFN